ncbi:dimethylmenaquinone methyltransferase [Candidatus Tenderia electrophaga]|uniref:Dimethylmenaquinone methyltransferase n=1 Tax=Candidatus Tenderia electrophaga TaxID=1748243 RepID=A0A0S2TB05_9GAMM|nr:dimethylmenaquinone methyltransferase [Candidatus Tenderia electrophaga]
MSIDPAFRKRLIQASGADNVLTEPSDCWPYGYDNSRRQALPEAVVMATDHAQIQRLVELCHQEKIPLIARGRGTGTTGATVPVHGGIVLSMERMTRLIKMDPANRVMVVEPGITNQQVQDAAKEHGFFWSPDPTSAAFCTVGGNLAYNSAGPRTVKYGATRDNVLGLRAVTGEGREIRTGVYTTKGVVGYDLTRLLIGSEGTLAVITEATLKLTPLPEAKLTLQAVYRDIGSAAAAVSAIMAQPVIPCALEFIDGQAIEMIRNYSQAELPEGAGAMLMIEVDGLEAGLEQAAERVAAAARTAGVIDVTLAQSEAEVQRLWQTRKALSPALRNIAPKKINEDVVVPVSEMPALIGGLEQLAQKYAITIVNFGHAGNGNIHVNLLIDPDDPQQMENADHCLDEVFTLVLRLNGSISGEHGVGLEKRDFVAREIDAATLELMRRIKAQFDPHNILNPGKTLPPAPG